MAKVFVTGANGFIGSHLVEELLIRGNQVVGLVRSTSDVRSLAPLFRQYPTTFSLIVGDILEPASMRPAMEGAEYVYHLAAVLLGLTEVDFFQANEQGTRNVLEVAKAVAGPTLKRVLVTSSLAAAGPSPDGTPLDETSPTDAVSWYGRSKVAAEEVVAQFAAQGLPTTVARPAAVYGEREMDLSRGMFPIVQAGLKPKVGFARKTASFVYVGDVVQGLIAAAEHPNTVGKTYFLADASPYTADTLTTAIADALGTRVRIPILTPHFVLFLVALVSEWLFQFRRLRPQITRDKVREVRRRHWVANPAAAQRDFQWTAQAGLDRGMRNAVGEWKDRVRRASAAHNEPFRDRFIKTMTVAIVLGIIEATVDLCAGGMDWSGFGNVMGLAVVPTWLAFILILIVALAVIVPVALLTARKSVALQFFVGAAAGIGLELLNQLWLDFWNWSPATFGQIPGPWLISLALGIVAGVAPVVTNAAVQAASDTRLRRG